MTIDEAIAKERKKEDLHRFNSCHIYAELYADDAEEIENAKNRCIKCAKEHEQIAEWLEELKALKNGLNIKCDNLNEALEKGKKIGYNKALDDFVKFASDVPTVEEEDGEIRPMWLEEIAEQLKEGAENEQSI